MTRDCLDDYRSRDLILARRFGVLRFGLFQDAGLRSNVLTAEYSVVIGAATSAAGTAATFMTITAPGVATISGTITTPAAWADAAAVTTAIPLPLPGRMMAWLIWISGHRS